MKNVALTVLLLVVGCGGTTGMAVPGEDQAPTMPPAIKPDPSPPVCREEVHIKFVAHSTFTVTAPTIGTDTLTFELTSICRDAEIKRIDFHIAAPDHPAESFAPFGGPAGVNFSNVRIREDGSNIVVAGPISPQPYTANEPAHLGFVDRITLKDGVARKFTIVTDVPASYISDEAEVRYSVVFNGLDAAAPVVVSYAPEFPSAQWPTYTVRRPECGVGNFQECYIGNPGTIGVGQCRAGKHLCVDGKWDTVCTGIVTPDPRGEVCGDGIDNDCNGQTDEGC